MKTKSKPKQKVWFEFELGRFRNQNRTKSKLIFQIQLGFEFLNLYPQPKQKTPLIWSSGKIMFLLYIRFQIQICSLSSLYFLTYGQFDNSIKKNYVFSLCLHDIVYIVLVWMIYTILFKIILILCNIKLRHKYHTFYMFFTQLLIDLFFV